MNIYKKVKKLIQITVLTVLVSFVIPNNVQAQVFAPGREVEMEKYYNLVPMNVKTVLENYRCDIYTVDSLGVDEYGEIVVGQYTPYISIFEEELEWNPACYGAEITSQSIAIVPGNESVLLHEVGHFVSCGPDNRFCQYSGTPEWQQIYIDESYNSSVSDYEKQDQDEYFAGIFEELYTNPLLAYQTAPRSCEYVEWVVGLFGQ